MYIFNNKSGYLIEYLLALTSSTTVSVPGIPVKIYGHYLPEEITALKCALHGNTIDGGLLAHFAFSGTVRTDSVQRVNW